MKSANSSSEVFDNKLPSNWRLLPIKYGFDLIGSGTTPPTGQEDYYGDFIPWVTTSELRESVIKATEKCVSESAIKEFTALKVYPPNTVLFAMYGATIGRVGILGVNACVNQAVCALAKPTEFDHRFTYYSLQSARDYLLGLASGGGQPNLNAEKIINLKLPCPPLPEQRAIADYLDRETARLDSLIVAKEHLLELLTEKRRAVITHAVTRGLNADVSLRDSGVEWLDKAPNHWKVVKLRYLSTEPLAYGANEAGTEDNPNYPRFIRITDITENGFLRDETFRSLPPDVAEPYLLKEGDILFARSGATVGKAFMYQKHWGKACFAGYLIRFRCNVHLVFPEFVFAFSQSTPYWTQISGGTIQATIQNFSGEKYGEVVIPLPPLDEQKAIIEYLKIQESKISNLAQSTQRTIDLLHERRASLIAAAVSGQVVVSRN